MSTLRCSNHMVTYHGISVSISLLKITGRIPLVTNEIMAWMVRNVSYLVKKTLRVRCPCYIRELDPFDFVRESSVFFHCL